VFLDPPYGQDLVGKALARLGARGWLAAGAVVVAELGPGDEVTLPEVLAERAHGKARLVFGRV
jgi:16S rRNA (guanine966-N2)-methyltransferase